MRQGYAFEFVGSMGGSFEGFGDRVTQAVDDLGSLFQDGLNLLGIVGSVVNLMELRKTTRLMEQTYSSEIFTDFIEQHQKSNDAHVAAEENAERKKADVRSKLRRSEAEVLIQKARNELLVQQESYRRDVEEQINDVRFRMAQAAGEAKYRHELRNMIGDVLQMSKVMMEMLQENEIKNRFQIAEFEEKIRKLSNKYYKTFQGSV